MEKVKQFARDEQGAEIAEYAVAVAILVAIAIAVLQVLNTAIDTKMNQVAGEIEPEPPAEAP